MLLLACTVLCFLVIMKADLIWKKFFKQMVFFFLLLIVPTLPQGLYLGMAKSVLVVVHINRGKKLFRSTFAVNELAFWNGWGIKDLVPVVRQVARHWLQTVRRIGVIIHHKIMWLETELSESSWICYLKFRPVLAEQNMMTREYVCFSKESAGCVTT